MGLAPVLGKPRTIELLLPLLLQLLKDENSEVCVVFCNLYVWVCVLCGLVSCSLNGDGDFSLTLVIVVTGSPERCHSPGVRQQDHRYRIAGTQVRAVCCVLCAVCCVLCC